MNEIVPVTGLSNQEFLEKYARPGCIGLSGGVSLIDRVIRWIELPGELRRKVWDRIKQRMG